MGKDSPANNCHCKRTTTHNGDRIKTAVSVDQINKRLPDSEKHFYDRQKPSPHEDENQIQSYEECVHAENPNLNRSSSELMFNDWQSFLAANMPAAVLIILSDSNFSSSTPS